MTLEVEDELVLGSDEPKELVRGDGLQHLPPGLHIETRERLIGGHALTAPMRERYARGLVEIHNHEAVEAYVEAARSTSARGARRYERLRADRAGFTP